MEEHTGMADDNALTTASDASRNAHHLPQLRTEVKALNFDSAGTSATRSFGQIDEKLLAVLAKCVL